MSRHVSQADVIRLGSDVAAVKGRLSPKAWKLLVKTAHDKGFTVGGQLSGQPDALKERTRKSLQQQALATVAAGYKPAESELDSQTAQIKALDSKRAADNKVYNTWLSGQQDKLMANARSADQQLATTQQNIETNTASAWANAQAAAQAAAAGTAGNVSNPQQSTALAGLGAGAQKDINLAANEHQRGTAQIGIGTQSLEGMIAATSGQQAAAESARQGDTYKALTDIASEKTKLEFQKGADAAKELDSLMQNNAQIASANADRNVAANKLNVTQQTAAAQLDLANKKFGLDQAKFKLSTWEAEHKDTADKAKLQLGYDKIKSSEGKAAADRALRKWIAEHKGTARSTLASDKHAGQSLLNQVSKARTMIAGVYASHTHVNTTKLRAELAAKGIDPDAINAAFDLQSPKYNHKLGPANRRILNKRLKGSGLSLPGGWLATANDAAAMVGSSHNDLGL